MSDDNEGAGDAAFLGKEELAEGRVLADLEGQEPDGGCCSARGLHAAAHGLRPAPPGSCRRPLTPPALAHGAEESMSEGEEGEEGEAGDLGAAADVEDDSIHTFEGHSSERVLLAARAPRRLCGRWGS